VTAAVFRIKTNMGDFSDKPGSFQETEKITTTDLTHVWSEKIK